MTTLAAAREALLRALEQVEPDNPVAAVKAIQRVGERFRPEALTSWAAFSNIARRLAEPFFEVREIPPAKAAVEGVLAPYLGQLVGGECDDPETGSCAWLPPGALVPLSDVEPEVVRWLWPNRIPLGCLTILDGDPGLGKSTLTLDIASRVAQGRAMPDGTPGLPSPAGVVLLSAEDGLSDTIRPRLDAAGGGAERVVALRFVSESRERRTRRLPTVQDIPELEAAISEAEAALVVVDPLMAYLGPNVNSHHDQGVRTALSELAELAERRRVAVVAVRHLNKGGGDNALYRGGGSIGIIGSARSGLIMARDPDEPDSDRRILASVKSNLGPKPASLQFRLIQKGSTVGIRWEGESGHGADSLLRRPSSGDRSQLEQAVEILQVELAEGPVAVQALKELVEVHGISWKTFNRAKQRIGVESRRSGYGSDGAWYWYIDGQGTWPPKNDSESSINGKSPLERASSPLEEEKDRLPPAVGTNGKGHSAPSEEEGPPPVEIFWEDQEGELGR